MARRDKLRILTVCTGNICRSPTAQAVLTCMIELQGLRGTIEVDSAGTYAASRTGDPPDPMAIDVAARRGYDLRALRARQFDLADFRQFDVILAMDRENLQHLRNLQAQRTSTELRLFMSYIPALASRDIPDPYRKSRPVFERALDLIEMGSSAALESLRLQLNRR